jgi:hypothetical protein
MIEIIVVLLLTWRNGKTVQAKGHDRLPYWLGTIGLWVGFEIVGFILGNAIVRPKTEDAFYGVYFGFGLGSAALGGVVSYLWANRAPALPGAVPTHFTPPTGLPAWAQPDPSAQPITVLPPQMPVAVVTRQGDWALVRIPGGWQGWVDARVLSPVPGAPVWQPPQQ